MSVDLWFLVKLLRLCQTQGVLLLQSLQSKHVWPSPELWLTAEQPRAIGVRNNEELQVNAEEQRSPVSIRGESCWWGLVYTVVVEVPALGIQNRKALRIVRTGTRA